MILSVASSNVGIKRNEIIFKKCKGSEINLIIAMNKMSPTNTIHQLLLPNRPAQSVSQSKRKHTIYLGGTVVFWFRFSRGTSYKYSMAEWPWSARSLLRNSVHDTPSILLQHHISTAYHFLFIFTRRFFATHSEYCLYLNRSSRGLESS